MSISVVIPLYNKAAYVRAAVESALVQEPEPCEVIVVDDGSTDGGTDLLGDLDAERVHILRQANAGVSVARNTGIGAARGDAVALLDADDQFRPGHLAAITDLMHRYPQAGLFGTGYRCVWPDGRSEDMILPLSGGTGLVDDFHRCWAARSFTCASAVALRRNALAELSPWFPPGERLGEDQDLWFRMAERFAVAYASQAQVDYRMDVPDSATASHAVTEPLPCYQRLAARLAAGEVPAPLRAGARRLLGSHWVNVANALFRTGRRKEGWALLRQSVARGNVLYWLRTLLRATMST